MIKSNFQVRQPRNQLDLVSDDYTQGHSVLLSAYNALKPKSTSGSDLDLMTTPCLIQRLANIESKRAVSQQTKPRQQSKESLSEKQFKNLDMVFLKKRLTILPNTTTSNDTNAATHLTLSMSYKTFLMRLGGRFSIKGSAIHAIENKSLIEPGNKKKDIDVYIEVSNLNFEQTTARFIKVIREALSDHHNKLSDEDLLHLYTRLKPKEVTALLSNQQQLLSDEVIKLRVNVDQDKCIAIDLNFYTNLIANFDRLLGSDRMRVDLHEQSAELSRLFDDKTADWIKEKNYIWLNEKMTHGLARIQKHFTHNPQLCLLQENVIATQLLKASSEEKISFLLWLLRKQPGGVTQSQLAQLMTPVAKGILDLEMTDSYQKVMQENLSYFKKNIEKNGLVFFNDQDQVQSTPLSDLENLEGYALLKCLTAIPKDFPTFVRECLSTHPEYLPTEQRIDQIFQRPNLKTLSAHWTEVIKNNNPFAATILEPITFSVLGKHLSNVMSSTQALDCATKKNHALLSQLLISLSQHSENIAQEIYLWDQQINYAKTLPTAEKITLQQKALQALMVIAKKTQTCELNTFDRYFLLNTIAKLSLNAKQFATLSQIFSSDFSLAPKRIQLHPLLKNQTKVWLLTHQAKEQIHHINQRIALRQKDIPKTVENTFDSIFSDYENYQKYFLELQTIFSVLKNLSALKNSVCKGFSLVKLQDSNQSLQQAILVNAPKYDALLSDEFIYVGQTKLAQASQNVYSLDGNGLLMRPNQTLLIGEFTQGFYKDHQATVITPLQAYIGPVNGESLGKGAIYQIQNKQIDAMVATIKKDFKDFWHPCATRYAFYGDFSHFNLQALAQEL